MWLDDCRIPFVDSDWDSAIEKRKSFVKTGNGHKDSYVGGILQNPIDTMNSINQQGRFTPNLLVCDDMLNDGSIGKSNGSNDYNWDLSNNNNPTKITKNIKSGIHFNDKGTNSRYYDLDKWFDKVIDEIQ